MKHTNPSSGNIGPSILIVRLSSLGDVILTTPFAARVKEIYPGARVTFLVKKAYAPVFAGNPHVDRLWIFEEKGFWAWLAEIKRASFDVYFDLHATGRSILWGLLSGISERRRYDKRTWERRWLVWFKKKSPRLEVSVKDRYLEILPPAPAAKARIYISPDENFSESWLADLKSGRYLGLAPGAKHGTKRWPAERFAAAADALFDEFPGAPLKGVLVFGAPEDRPSAQKVMAQLKSPVLNLAGRTSLRDMFLALKQCALVLTNDSGAMHAAVALDVPTVAVFGPTVEAFGFYPEKDTATVVENVGLACRPCSLHGTERCPLGHFLCMLDIPVDSVVAAAQKLLAVPL